MKFTDEKKKNITLYLLEKISQDDENISKTVAENFAINQDTVHSYINKLIKDKVIRRVKRGKYEIVEQRYKYFLRRSEGHLDTDTYAYEACLKQHISDLESNVVSIWAYAFSEMVNNVMDHSEAERLDIVIEQDYLNTSVAIMDDGIGIFEKIKNYFNLPSHDAAICELFKGKLTTDSENHSGEGIFFSSKLMDEFAILSSEKIFASNKYDVEKTINLDSKKILGTCVIMTLSNFSKKLANEVFDMYSNDEGNFTKTKIPLKNIFDTSPVSRSQAKRVCNHLDKFKEVILDFEGLEWMGQGFAHQIFVVFANSHPDISLMPINMNEEITKMYNHVKLSSN